MILVMLNYVGIGVLKMKKSAVMKFLRWQIVAAILFAFFCYFNNGFSAYAETITVEVSDESGLINAINGAYGDEIRIELKNDINYTLGDGLVVDGNVTIDSKGFLINITNTKYLFDKIADGAKLSFKNTEIVNVKDSIIGDNYGEIVFESTVDNGIKVTAERSNCSWQDPDGNDVWVEVCDEEGAILINNYGTVHFVDGKYVSVGNNIIESVDGGIVIFDNGYYDSLYEIIHKANDATIIINNGEFISKKEEAFDYIYNSNITIYNGKITSNYCPLYVEDDDSDDYTTITIYGGVFEALNDAVIYNYADSGGTSILNIYSGDFLSHSYQAIYNYANAGGSAATNIYGGNFKSENADTYGHPVVYNYNSEDGSVAIINLLGESIFETDNAISSVFKIENNAQVSIDPGYYADPDDFLSAYTNKLQILPRDIKFGMTYLPGADNAVINLPASDSGISQHEYVVSSTIPEREGYVFVDWTLDYKIKTQASYKICYLDANDRTTQLADCETISNVEIGSEITITNNKEITSYKPVEGQTKTITINGNDSLNVIVFYFEQNTVAYTVHYVDRNGFDIIDPTVREKSVGSIVTEYPEDLYDIRNPYGFPYFLQDDYDHIDIDVTEETEGQHYYFRYNTETRATIRFINATNGAQIAPDIPLVSIVGEYHVAQAVPFDGYDILGPSEVAIEFREDPGSNIIIFLYMESYGPIF